MKKMSWLSGKLPIIKYYFKNPLKLAFYYPKNLEYQKITTQDRR
jgi:hypothetical protein